MLGFTWSTGYILCIHKSKYNRWTRRHMPKTMKLTGNTSEMLRHYVGEKGHIFINGRTGKRLTLRHFEKMIDKWARLLNIQKLQSIKPSDRVYYLFTLMGPKGGRIFNDISIKFALHFQIFHHVVPRFLGYLIKTTT